MSEQKMLNKIEDNVMKAIVCPKYGNCEFNYYLFIEIRQSFS